jgi:16S rRNA (adenine(1408)-N(1))-methyltransferase
MAESSLRAARPAARGGQPNLIFAVAATERPPIELCGRIDEVTVLFPWGSLLRGVLALDDAAAAGLAALLGPPGRIAALVSVAERDARAAGVRPLSAADRDALTARWRRHGLDLMSFRPATNDEIVDSGSTWAKRLRTGGAGTERQAWRLELACEKPLAERCEGEG